MSVLQDHDIVHRNIKPENIFLDKHGQLVISDFGLGRVFRHVMGSGLEAMGTEDFWHHTAGECGTPRYMALEMLGDEHYSNKTDGFSIRVIFYKLVFRRVSVFSIVMVFVTH